MLSRVASSLYWLSRYLERADNVARVIDVNVHLMLDLGIPPDNAQWHPLVVTSGDEVQFAQLYSEPTEEHVLRFLTFDERNPNSILSCINHARENARTVREVISSEIWEAINELYHLVRQHDRQHQTESLRRFYIEVRKANHLLSGLFENTMSHGEGWHFARMGRMMERADKTARILDVKYFLLLPAGDAVDSPHDAVEWGAVLKSVDAFEMYRQQYHRLQYHDAAGFLVFSHRFPRSLTYCVEAAARSLDVITAMLGVEVAATGEMHALRQNLHESSIEDVFTEGMHEFIDRFQLRLNEVDGAVHQSFFAQ